MSTFVEIAPDEYDATAFNGFDASAGGLTIDNARALMWMAQLAYETHQPSTIQVVSGKWGFSSAISFSKSKTELNGSFETCGIIAERQDAVILAFAGTDPGVWQNLATDFNARPTANTDKHAGFELAAEAAVAEVTQAAQISRQSQKPLFITGHSLGASLAALAAEMAVAGGSPPRAVYTFGMPRVGGSKFQASYNARLGELTYRLVHGIDLVARVPMSSLGFRHVGRLLQCATGTKFTAAQPLSQVGSDDPAFAEELANIFLRQVNNIVSGRILSAAGPGTFGPVFQFLPPEIRDHLQDSYYKALTP
jgi:triacylglycerol lipase